MKVSQFFHQLFSVFIVQILFFGEILHATNSVTFVCQPSNDIFTLFPQGTWPRYDSLDDGITHTPPGGSILYLAPSNPFDARTSVSPSHYDKMRQKGLSLYLEFPDSKSVPGLDLSDPVAPNNPYRIVATPYSNSSFLPKFQILMSGGSYLLQATCSPPSRCFKTSYLVYAHVAGFDRAIFGLPSPDEMYPVLFQYDDPSLLGPNLWISTIKLSNVIKGRYYPKDAWNSAWNLIFSLIAQSNNFQVPLWNHHVEATYGPNEQLPENYERIAFIRATDWFIGASEMVVIEDPNAPKFCVAPYANGTGTVTCVLEGYESAFDWKGNQALASDVRSDCVAETAMAVSLRTLIGCKESECQKWAKIGSDILDYLYFYSDAQKGPRGDPNNPAYGLVAWGVSSAAWEVAVYGDDSARVILGSVLASTVLNKSSWNEAIMKSLLANLRTTGKYGYRPERIDIPDLESNGWEFYFNRETNATTETGPQPHYQSYLWAAFIWAYRQTKFPLFLEKAYNGISSLMSIYPDHWRWTEYFSEEQAHMLLPLAWLVQVQDTPETRGWLQMIAHDILAYQQDHGNVQERLGKAGFCDFCPPSRNSDYATGENPLIQENGDPASDLLYTQNFLFLGLREAYAATKDEVYLKAEDKLAEFLVRVQTHSDLRPNLNGTWFRAFDYERWEAWASASDVGWGPWSVETGWTQTWISTTLAMRLLNTSFWEFSAKSTIDTKLFHRLCPNFLPQDLC